MAELKRRHRCWRRMWLGMVMLEVVRKLRLPLSTVQMGHDVDSLAALGPVQRMSLVHAMVYVCLSGADFEKAPGFGGGRSLSMSLRTWVA